MDLLVKDAFFLALLSFSQAGILISEFHMGTALTKIWFWFLLQQDDAEFLESVFGSGEYGGDENRGVP